MCVIGGFGQIGVVAVAPLQSIMGLNSMLQLINRLWLFLTLSVSHTHCRAESFGGSETKVREAS